MPSRLPLPCLFHGVLKKYAFAFIFTTSRSSCLLHRSCSLATRHALPLSASAFFCLASFAFHGACRRLSSLHEEMPSRLPSFTRIFPPFSRQACHSLLTACLHSLKFLDRPAFLFSRFLQLCLLQVTLSHMLRHALPPTAAMSPQPTSSSSDTLSAYRLVKQLHVRQDIRCRHFPCPDFVTSPTP